MTMLVLVSATTCRIPVFGSSTARWALVSSRQYRAVSFSVYRGGLSALQLPSSYNDESRHRHYDITCTGQQIRFFAAAPDPSEKKDEAAEDEGSFVNRAIKSVLTPQNQFYALVAGGTFGAYAISRVFLSFTSFFTHLTPTTIVKWGFYTGFVSATFVGGLALVTFDNLYIRADPVYKYCLKWVQNDTVVQQTLGDGLQAGNLRSYRLDSGKLEVVGRTTVWRPPRIQVRFKRG
jgi:hypothetical protein